MVAYISNCLVRPSTNFYLRIIQKFIFLAAFVKILTISSISFGTEISLTSEEKAWLDNHPVIRVGVDSYPPFEFVHGQGAYSGIIPDYLKLISERLGIEFKPVLRLTWTQVMKGIKDGIVDMAPGLNDTPERREFLTFTKTYLTSPMVVFTRNDFPSISGLSDLTNKSITIPSGYSDIEMVKKQFPSIKIVEVKSLIEALTVVATGEIEATLGNLAVGSYLIHKHHLANLMVAAPSENAGSKFAMGVRKDWPELAGILDKALASLTPEEIQMIHQKWVGFASLKDVIEFTAEEQAWLDKKQTVRVRMSEAPPYLFSEDGNPNGIAFDFLNIIKEITGIKFHFVIPSPPYSEDLKKIKHHEGPDLLAISMRTSDREKYLLFTQDFISSPRYIFTRDDAPFISGISDLTGHTVAIVKGFVTHEYFLEYHPEIQLVLHKDIPSALKSVSENKTCVFIGGLKYTSNVITRLGLTNLKVAAPSSMPDHTQAMAIRNDWPELQSILTKAIDAIPDNKKAAIINKWSSVKFEHGLNSGDLLKWILMVIGSVSIIVFLFFFWNRSLTRKIKERTYSLENSKNSLEIEIIERLKVKRELIYQATLLENVSDAIFSVNKNFEIISWNTASEKIYGWTFHEVRGKKSNEVLKIDYLDKKREAVIAEINNKGVWYGETKQTQKNGETIYIQATISILEDENKGLIGYVTVNRDVTAHKQVEDEKNRILNMSSDLICIAGIDGYFKYVNPSWEKSLGYSTQDFLTRPFLDFIHPEDHVRNNDEVARLSAGQKTFDFENRYVCEDGSVRTISWTATPLPNEKVMYCIGRDITDLKKAIEENEKTRNQLHQAHKMEAIGTLAGGIAHDFNNILSSILGYTDLSLYSVEKGSEIEKDLREIQLAGIRAKDLVKQILMFARNSEEKVVPIKVATIVKEVLKFIRSSTPSTIEIKHDIVSNSLIMGNPTQIHQIMMNLCTNASYAMEKGGGVLEIKLHDITLDEIPNKKIFDFKFENYIKLEISDTGMGIAPKIFDRIFEPYFTTKGPAEGTGLGLSMVHGIIESYSGNIVVNSTLGKGTILTIYLPVTKKRETLSIDELETLLSGTERILFVDDEISITKMVSRVLSQLGYSVTTKTSSLEALELFKSKPEEFDLIISDMTMPQMTGDNLAIELMKIRSGIPVILCTGYSKKISDETVSDIGIKALVYKPVVKADLAKIVRKVLDEANPSE